MFLIHYSEIALKKGNRKYFENKLTHNLVNVPGVRSIRMLPGRIVMTADTTKFSEERLNFVPGVVWWAQITPVNPSDWKEVETTALALMLTSGKEFAVRVHQTGAVLPDSSMTLEKKLGEVIRTKLVRKVNLTKPDTTLWLEIVSPKTAFMYTGKHKGVAGLPVGTSGRAVALLSGGIDSPVASNMAQKRGLELVFVHCHSYPVTSSASVEKVKKLASVLAAVQGGGTLYLVPIVDAQKELVGQSNQVYLVLLYRRLMLRIAQAIAGKEQAQAIVTGDSLGQVASQTIDNIAIQSQAVKLQTIRPLIALDKEEIITRAKQLGTYETAILPHQDCCSLFVPKHPATKARMEDVLREEEKSDIDKLLHNALEKVEIVNLKV